MKREEAINLLGWLKSKTNRDDDLEAIDMAIEALQAEPTHGRLIDADALKGLMEKRKQFFVDAYGGSFHCMSEKDKARCDEIDACIASIVNAPTVQADRPHGEWEDKEVFNETDDDHIVDEWQSARCSVCGKYHTTPYMYYFDNFNFCPNCGAKMKGGEQNDA